MVADFDQHFLAYATHDAQPRFVLDKDIQQKIARYRTTIGKEIYISFVNSDLFVAVTEPKDILEPSIYTSNISFELVHDFFNDIQLLLGIIQDFDGRKI